MYLAWDLLSPGGRSIEYYRNHSKYKMIEMKVRSWYTNDIKEEINVKISKYEGRHVQISYTVKCQWNIVKWWRPSYSAHWGFSAHARFPIVILRQILLWINSAYRLQLSLVASVILSENPIEEFWYVIISVYYSARRGFIACLIKSNIFALHWS